MHRLSCRSYCYGPISWLLLFLLAALPTIARAGEDNDLTETQRKQLENAFWEAAGDNNIPLLEKILAAHPHLGSQLEPPLIDRSLNHAVFNSNLEAIDWLLQHGADVNAFNNSDKPLLVRAFYGKHNPLPVIQILLKHGADPTAQGKADHCPLAITVNQRNLTLLKLCLDHCTDAEKTAATLNTLLRACLADYGYQYQTPTDQAATRAVIQVLLEHHADPNATDTNGASALACLLRKPTWGERKMNSPELLDLLFQYGADPNQADHHGNTPMNVAINDQPMDVIEQMVARGGRLNVAQSADTARFLHRAILHSRAQLVAQFLKEGGDVNLVNENGRNAMYTVFERLTYSESGPKPVAELETIARLLLDHDIDLTLGKVKGWSIFDAAALAPNATILCLLLDKGIDPNLVVCDPYNEPVLCWAIDNVKPDLVIALLDHGADPNAANYNRVHSLRIALQLLLTRPGKTPTPPADAIRILTALLDHGADPNKSDGYYGSALLCAQHTVDQPPNPYQTISAQPPADPQIGDTVIRLLLDHGADVNLCGAHNGSPFHYAAQNSSPDRVDLFLAHGGNPMTRDKYGKTVLLTASAQNFNRLYQVVTPFPMLWLPVAWLLVIGLAYTLLRRRWQLHPSVLATQLPPTTTPAVTSAVPAAPAPDSETIAQLQREIAAARDQVELHSRLSWLALLSWLLMFAARFVEPILRATPPDQWWLPGGLTFGSVVCLALVHSNWRRAILPGVILSWALVLVTLLWSFHASHWRIKPGQPGLLLLLGLHTSAMVWMTYHVVRIHGQVLRIQQLEKKLREKHQVGLPTSTAAQDDFETAAGWDEHRHA